MGVPDQKKLFDSAMKDDWDEVVKVYKERKQFGIHKAQITSSGDTALHVAVSAGLQGVVKQLIEVLGAAAKDALKIQNDNGNTPLHLAAAMGNIPMCRWIIEADEHPVGVRHEGHGRDCLLAQRNEEGHTPLFMTALYGNMDAFILLYRICKPQIQDHYRGKNGETILHCAINGEYFGLSLLILDLDGDLASRMDERGRSPLHLLANKPQLFRSCTIFNCIKFVVYSCITVKMLPESILPDPIINQTYQESVDIEAQSDEWFPPNYNKCWCFLNIIYRVLLVIFGFFKRATRENAKYSGPAGDAKNPIKENAERHDHTGLAGNAKELPQGEGLLKFPPNYGTCIELLKLVCKLMLVVLGLGYNEIQRIKEVKEKHVWSVQILRKMLQSTSTYEYDAGGRSGSSTSGEDGTSVTDFVKSPQEETNKKAIKDGQDKSNREPEMTMDRKETPILTAAKNGIQEVVELILTHFPIAIHDRNTEKKNIVLLTVENRQPHLYDFLKRKYNKDNVFKILDNKGNSALHLAANYSESMNPRTILGDALQMQWEIKWYEYVRSSMPRNFFMLYNNEGMTAVEIFTTTHKSLVKEGGKWLNKTSNSCSVVAALIASVAFAATVTIPGGTDKGKPFLENDVAFRVFSVSSLVSFACSVTSLVMFLGILTSRYRENEFRMALLKNLLWGLLFLLIAIAAILVSFCSGHFFILDDRWRSMAIPIYAVTCLPATIFLQRHLSLFLELMFAIFIKVPATLYNVEGAPVGQLNLI